MTRDAAASPAARPLRVPAPAPQAEALRRTYLELLKLCLCDLAGAGTMSVRGLADGDLASCELARDDLQQRVEGRDWPWHALTMAGLLRLDDLQKCVESVVADGVAGHLIETGAWRGGASILMRATLDSLGAADRTVWVADSFEGFPRSEPGDEFPRTLGPYLAAFEFLAVPLEQVQESFARLGCERGVRFLPGLFQETLPQVSDQRWAVVRLDGDTYDATRTALDHLYRGLEPGGYLIVDDYGALEECRAAVDRFRSEQRITEPLEEVDWTCVRWRRERST